MLKHLLISNYALIDRTEVTLDDAFTVITGETGAGKSILLEALSLVLGSRANFNSIRKGEEKSVVEAVFSYSDRMVDERLNQEGLDVLDDLIMRRELTSAGRSRAFINDSPVSLQLMREVAMFLVDMHGQQENIALQSTAYQMRQLDLFAKHKHLIDGYTELFAKHRRIHKEVEGLKEALAQVRKDEDYIRFQLDELSEIELSQEEFQNLEEDLNKLEHVEDIERALATVTGSLDNDQGGVLSDLQSALGELQSVTSFQNSLKELFDRLKSTEIELQDIQSECDRIHSNLDADPKRLEAVRDRLDIYQRLMLKHGVSEVSALIQVKEDYRLKLEGIESYDDNLEELEKELKRTTEALKERADALSESRRNAATDFEEALMKQVRKLGMEKAQLKIALEKSSQFHSTGQDLIDIRFDANGNTHLVPLKESASGGEVARLMLALKSIIAANDQTPTLIFDEIDTGVSGEVAKQIGSLMKSIAASTQIISVTHLPGVAAKGEHHIRIRKREEEGTVVSRLEVLNPQDRVEEIASMFSGKSLTDASLQSASALLNEA